MPVPFATRNYPGKFNLRVGEHLHRQLAVNAAQEHLSLNEYLVRRLSDAS
ncbi:toxin-antitoxin system HicB family antitoxin [Ornithinimicrobium ciconiae]|uniref:Toxin-antitoxin system HicB family antitoxin n=1 Tax=Ornithinimicrobium ciconiae TaxID=2594265 RepID=A0A516G685_9MICO|nr:toxin-antitoxin system HicB family antitoxin [Ornithinimicrobium ciconiae]QDO87036.1 toxin-antitoxin system HicB family antitoxin [Ornithinimicrobium ciconiae]